LSTPTSRSGAGAPSGVTLDPPSAAAAAYGVADAAFGPCALEAGIAGDVALVNDGSGVPTDACEPLVGFRPVRSPSSTGAAAPSS
jgi:hypothetical protein